MDSARNDNVKSDNLNGDGIQTLYMSNFVQLLLQLGKTSRCCHIRQYRFKPQSYEA